MAKQQGGMRRPQNPAPVSGPGSLSQRTDGGPQQVLTDVSGMPYGENQELEAMQSSAPMSASTSAKSPKARQRQTKSAMEQVTPLFSPTQRPEEPVTDGASFGPGAGVPTRPGMRSMNNTDAETLSKYLPSLLTMAESPETPDGFKRFVRHLKNLQAGI